MPRKLNDQSDVGFSNQLTPECRSRTHVFFWNFLLFRAPKAWNANILQLYFVTFFYKEAISNMNSLARLTKNQYPVWLRKLIFLYPFSEFWEYGCTCLQIEWLDIINVVANLEMCDKINIFCCWERFHCILIFVKF